MSGPSDSHHARRGANRALVAGIGNIFMGDDGFGCEVVRRLQCCDLPTEVDVVDFGIRGLDLGYALMDDYAKAILVDTVQRGGPPGTLYVIAPEIDTSLAESGEELITPHGMDPAKVLRFIATLGDRAPQVVLVACEPVDLGGDEGRMGLSNAVDAAVDAAVAEVRGLIAKDAARHTQMPVRTEFKGAPAPGGVS